MSTPPAGGPASTPPVSSPVWAKGGRPQDASLAALNVAYTAGRDVAGRPAADHALVAADLETNAAHALMLGEVGILTDDEQRRILAALLDVKAAAARGEAIVDPRAEDVHMSIEQRVTAAAGPGAGGRLHTGRSRNDQVATDMRLWLRGEVLVLGDELRDLVGSLLKHAARHAATVCPGMTHMQPAMVTTWGHWTASYIPRVLRDMRQLAALLDDLDECPLGAAAAFGTSWPINRERTAELLGFARPTRNGADGIWSRGELEARFAAIAASVLGHLAGIGQDLILLSTPPRLMVRLPDEFTTGSSIMPQKRNPDFAEVTRARAAVARGHAQSLAGIIAPAAGGYNRDSQWTKYAAMDVADEVRHAATVFARVFDTLRVNADAMRGACSIGFLNATDVADTLARTRGLAFRDCYKVVGAAVVACEAAGELSREAINAELAKLAPAPLPLGETEFAVFADPVKLLMQRSQVGSPHPDRVLESLEQMRADFDEVIAPLDDHRENFIVAHESLWSQVAARLA